LDWNRHKQAVQAMGSEEGLRWLSILTQPTNIGEEDQGQIRPGELGKWDVYYFLFQNTSIPKAEALLLSGLNASQVEEQDFADRHGIEPSDTESMKQARRLDAMAPDELDDEITRLEALLG